jgi:hypothetical protein
LDLPIETEIIVMNKARGFFVALWLCAALVAGISAWWFAPYRFVLGTVAVLLLVGAVYVGRTDL